MSQKYLGVPFDIHCGGIDHIEIHHPNEIAQSKAAFGKNPARFWMHAEFLTVKEEKMSKSKGNFYTLKDIKKNYSPLSYRYLCLNSHYRSKMNFSKKAMKGAQNSLKKMKERVSELESNNGTLSQKHKDKFLKAINNDLNTPQALKITWNLLKNKNIKGKDKLATIKDFDRLLGLNLVTQIEIPKNIEKLAAKREMARKDKDFETADKIRKRINELGYKIKDDPQGYKLIKK
jgi:cysteinyl-tRNA synthetase